MRKKSVFTYLLNWWMSNWILLLHMFTNENTLYTKSEKLLLKFFFDCIAYRRLVIIIVILTSLALRRSNGLHVNHSLIIFNHGFFLLTLLRFPFIFPCIITLNNLYRSLIIMCPKYKFNIFDPCVVPCVQVIFRYSSITPHLQGL